MKIAYLHLGTIKHGVHRYGKLLAEEARKNPEVEVVEYQIGLTENDETNGDLFKQTAIDISQAGVDMVHLQCSCLNNVSLWGKASKQCDNLKLFFDYCSVPIAVTIHDLFLAKNIVSHTLWQIYFRFFPKVQFVPQKPAQVGFWGSGALFLNEIVKKSKIIFVFTESQKEDLQKRYGGKNIVAIPHFVETRGIKFSREDARLRLGFKSDDIVITIQGFIYPGKGHDLLLKASSNLPSNVKIVFAGGIERETDHQIIDELTEMARKNDLEDRLKITGYLSEEELQMYLIATDVAVCPFLRHSASGSLSTWISVGRPIIASDIPLIREYNKIEPNAIEVFSPYDAIALSATIENYLNNTYFLTEKLDKIKSLQKHLNIYEIAQKHLSVFKLGTSLIN